MRCCSHYLNRMTCLPEIDGVMLYAANRRRKHSAVLSFAVITRRLSTAVLATIGLVAVVVTCAPVLKWWWFFQGPTQPTDGDVLIVLGAETHPDAIGESSYLRCLFAVRAWREGRIKHIVVAGGPPESIGGQVPVSHRMRDFLISQGIPGLMISTEDESTSTRENALFVKPILKTFPGPKLLLTSDYHIFRAGRTFREVGISVRLLPAPDALACEQHWNCRIRVLETLAIETTKIVAYWWRGWL